MEGLAAALDPGDDEGDVLDLDRNPDACLDEVPLGVAPEQRPEVGEDPRVGDLDVVVEPVAVHIDAEPGQRPLFRRRSALDVRAVLLRGHSNTTLAKETTPLGSGHWP